MLACRVLPADGVTSIKAGAADCLDRDDPEGPTGEGARLRQGSGVAGRSAHVRARVLPFPDDDPRKTWRDSPFACACMHERMNSTTTTTNTRHGKHPGRGGGAGVRRRLVTVGAAALLILGLVWASFALQHVTASTSSVAYSDSDRLYGLTNVWTIHLTFTPDRWEALEPRGGLNPFGGGPPGGAPGGQRGGVGGPGGARTLAPVIMAQADSNRDGRIAPGEFATLAQTWFEAWDAGRAGALDERQVRAGLKAIRNPAGGGVATMLLAPDGKRNGISAALGIEFEYVHADVEFAHQRLKDVGVRYKGNGTFMESRGSLKRSLKIETDKYVKGQSLGGKQLYLARLDEFGRTLFKPERIAQQVDQIAAVIRPAVQEESESKLARFDKLVAGESLAAPGPFGGGQTKPIKPFAQARTPAVLDQLAGKSEGLSPGHGFPGGPGRSGLGTMFSRPLFQTLDANKDSSVTQGEFTQGFVRLFQAWNTDRSQGLTFEQLRSGIAKDLPPQREGFSEDLGHHGRPTNRL